MTRTRALAWVVSVITLTMSVATVAACDPDPRAAGAGARAAEYAVYAEHSLSDKPMLAGWNARVFNTREAQEGQSISLDDQTGVVTLKPGRYHITASSMVNYYDSTSPTTMPMSSAPRAGYARIRHLADTGNAKALSVGTGSNADAIPSLMDTIVAINNEDTEAKLMVEHQVSEESDAVQGIYLQVNGNGTPWHSNARIAIERL